MTGCFVELTASYLPDGITSSHSIDHGGAAHDPVTGIGVSTGFFLDAYGVGVHAGPTGFGTSETYTTDYSESTRTVSGPHLRLDVDLPVPLPSPHNLRLTTAFALPRRIESRRPIDPNSDRTVTGSGGDVFLGATISTLLHDLSLTIGGRRVWYDQMDATSGLGFSGTGVQVRLMVRLGDAALHVLRRRSMWPAREGCRYERYGYRCP